MKVIKLSLGLIAKYCVTNCFNFMITPPKQFDYELRGILFYHGKLVRGVLFRLKSWVLRLLRLI